ncbi:MAG: hypothetical protein KJ626_10590, partial [Verrucomicrobia bacterium]|nr:hypothetical protein [Verrucomicrobiota bacterium]
LLEFQQEGTVMTAMCHMIGVTGDYISLTARHRRTVKKPAISLKREMAEVLPFWERDLALRYAYGRYSKQGLWGAIPEW